PFEHWPKARRPAGVDSAGLRLAETKFAAFSNAMSVSAFGYGAAALARREKSSRRTKTGGCTP
ncbi:MAG: hypothetical protein ACLFVH_11140, partial [Phycisphaerae bacterium]